MSEMSPTPGREYEVVFTHSAERDLERIEKSDRQALVKIDAKIMGLALVPRPIGVEKLSGQVNRYRIRSGDYRIVYSVGDADGTVTLQIISHRRDVYRRR